MRERQDRGRETGSGDTLTSPQWMRTPSVHQDKAFPKNHFREGLPEVTSRSGQGHWQAPRSACGPSLCGPSHSSSRCSPPRATLPSVILPPRPAAPTASGLAYLPPVRTFGDKPGHEKAHEAPENTHHDQRHSEAVVRHACTSADQPVRRLTLVPPGSVNSGSRDLRTKAPPLALSVTRPSDSAPWAGAPPSPSLSLGCSLELVRGEVPVTRGSTKFSGKNLDLFRRCVIYSFSCILRADVKSLKKL